jgi:predicted ArsR family transcriptional regulator
VRLDVHKLNADVRYTAGRLTEVMGVSKNTTRGDLDAFVNSGDVDSEEVGRSASAGA